MCARKQNTTQKDHFHRHTFFARHFRAFRLSCNFLRRLPFAVAQINKMRKATHSHGNGSNGTAHTKNGILIEIGQRRTKATRES